MAFRALDDVKVDFSDYLMSVLQLNDASITIAEQTRELDKVAKSFILPLIQLTDTLKDMLTN